MSHTPEPWSVDGLTVFGRCGNEPGKWLRDPATPVWVAQMITGTPSKQDFANGQRITTCVNAMAGIPDPAAYIARAKAIEAAAKHACQLLRFMHDRQKEEGEYYLGSGTACEDVSDAIGGALNLPGAPQ